MKKIYAVMGSHRRAGYTDKALKLLLENLSDRFEIKRCDVIKKKISYCIGCEKCRDIGKCIHKDDMSTIYEDIKEADILIFAAPVYFSAYPAALKALIDRGQYFFNNPLNDKKRKVYTLSVGGAPYYDNQFRAIPLTLEFFLKNINAELAGNYEFSESDTFENALPENICREIVCFAASIH